MEIYAEIAAGICEEMGNRLRRAADSPNIKTRRDYSCALLIETEHGLEVAAQAAHIPVHLGSIDTAVAACRALEPDEREILILNDPFAGGTHLPDITLAARAKAGLWLAVRAHHADVGGLHPGSMAGTREIAEEGFRIAPTRFSNSLLEEFARRSRNPRERRADLQAQTAALHAGFERLEALEKRNHPLDEMLKAILETQARRFETAFTRLPDQSVSVEDFLEDGEEILPVGLRLTLRNGRFTFTFSPTPPTKNSNLNAPFSVTRSAILYVLQSAFGDARFPTTAAARFLTIEAEPGTLFHATFPAAVAGGNVETSQRAVDLALQAFGKILPNRFPACSQGTMNNLTIGTDTWAYYETIGGGAGGAPEGPGASAIQSHMTNTLNTPAEELAACYPLRLVRNEIRRGSGGRGRHRGGDGLIREIEVREECTAGLVATRRRTAPPGAAGGESGLPGRDILIRFDGSEEPFRETAHLRPGDRIRIETPGGGGWGR